MTYKSLLINLHIIRGGNNMKTRKKAFEFIKIIAMKNAKSTMNAACFGFCYQPISPRKKQFDKQDG